MLILSGKQFNEWDKYTMQHSGISAIDLMERAAQTCCQWLRDQHLVPGSFSIFCGKGNNGGDGLAIARMLIESGSKVTIYIPESKKKGTHEFEINFQRLQSISGNIIFVGSLTKLSPIAKEDIIIDALFGTGLHSPVDGISGSLIDHINSCRNNIISIDVPSGLYIDETSMGNKIVRATETISFQAGKLAFYVAENSEITGNITILDIGLLKDYASDNSEVFSEMDFPLLSNIYKPRKQFTHKGNYGFACIIAGGKGMMGAAVLATRACLKGGSGKVTCICPETGTVILQVSAPEAMVRSSGKNAIKVLPDLTAYNAIGIGPGLGIKDSHKKLLKQLFVTFTSPIVIDADALNVIAQDKSILSSIPANSILTPHPKEFDNLFGESANDFDRIAKARDIARECSIYIILKGHKTLIACPNGKAYFNSTGNAGMATGGSGDVLTGLLTSLLAQGYSSSEASMLGVYLHGVAGDICAEEMSQEAMIAGNIIDHFGDAFMIFN